MLRKFLQKLKDRWQQQGRTSYAQCGEDIIASFLLQDLLKIAFPSYLDIGAHHPTYLSNTYLFYQMGCSGVCVEPDVTLCRQIERERKRDVCLNAGVGTSDEASANFYILSTRTLNTFSKQEAELQVQTENQGIEKITQVPLLSINGIIEKHFRAGPNFISLDTEGMELAILKSLAFEKFRPEVLCVETLTYPDERKIAEITALMFSKRYLMYADTYINTIFVDEIAWQKRGLSEGLRLCLRQ